MTAAEIARSALLTEIRTKGRRRGTIAGQAMTEYGCITCGEHYIHPNTSTPLICDDCNRLEDAPLGYRVACVLMFGHSLPPTRQEYIGEPETIP